jgi:hypothetical protein
MAVQTRDLWSLVRSRPQVDPDDLVEAIEDQVAQESLDYRTRLLIRDCVSALRKHWGDERLQAWLSSSPHRREIEAICGESFNEVGFPSLTQRIMEKTNPEEVKQYLRELGLLLHRPVQVYVGGAVALILPTYISRRTEDVDIVDEVPAELRSLHQPLAQLKKRYGLSLTHFQSHYLPHGWEQRLHSQEPFGQLRVFLVDAYDVFLSKLTSKREKDLDDLREVAPHLDKETLVHRLKETMTSLLAEPDARQRAEHNWYILYGEALPS